VSDGHFKLVLDTNGKTSLFDIEADPWENSDISKDHPDLVNQMKQWLG
jgi:hypothetical protein